MARRTIAAEVKAAVVAAALLEGADLPAIATQYGVSLPTVYNWKNAATRTTTAQPVETAAL
ncbi:MAG: helix-turn-helix domain-containing protein [bacterium]